MFFIINQYYKISYLQKSSKKEKEKETFELSALVLKILRHRKKKHKQTATNKTKWIKQW